MADIAPELYERIKERFEELYNAAADRNSWIREIRRKLDNKTATFRDADLYAAEVGNILSDTLKEVLKLDDMPNSILYFNIAEKTIGTTLQESYGLVTSVAAEVQEELNAANGIGIKAITPPVNNDRIRGLVSMAADAKTQKELDSILTDPIENLMMSAVDETVKRNAQFQAKSGLQPIIKRTVVSGCCDWCAALAGIYKYPDDVPDDVYHRHKCCRCIVEYMGAGKKQNVWTKKEDVLTKQEAETIEKKIIEKESEQERRKIGGQGQEIIDKATYNRITKPFVRNGGIIIRGEDARKHLENAGAFASYLPGFNTAFIRDDATVSDVLEEMRHAYQDRSHMYGEILTNEVFLRREIEAQQYLINVENKYRIPGEEMEITRKNLEYYKAELKRLLEDGK